MAQNLHQVLNSAQNVEQNNNNLIGDIKMAKGKKLGDKTLLIIVLALGLVVFNIIFFTCSNFKEGKAAFWSAYAFITLAFIIVGVLLGLTKHNKDIPLVANVPFYKIIGLYSGISFVFNLIFLFFPDIHPIAWNLIPNILLLIAFVAIFIFYYLASRQVTGHTKEINEKVAAMKAVEGKVSGLLYRSSDPTIKGKLQKLKDTITYSDPMGVPGTAEAEADIERQIAIIKELILDSADPSQIIAAIDEAIIQVKLRNELLLSLK